MPSAYAHAELRPVEALLLLRYREAFSRRVLEIGCGAGRITNYLVELSDDLYGIDVSAAMVRVCQQRFPAATFAERDLRDLSAHDVAFGAVMAGFNVIDAIGDADRRAALRGFRRVLDPAGVLVFSTHNRAYTPRIRKPTNVAARDPVRLAKNVLRLPLRLHNRHKLGGLRQNEPGYAILNDEAHNYALLHYYIGRDAQAQQLADEGFELLECLALDGTTVDKGATADTSPELHYVARRVP